MASEGAGDSAEVEALYDLVFGPERLALSSYMLRNGVDPVPGLGTVYRDEAGLVAGAIRCWPVRTGPAPALLVGPVGVHPTRQGEGLGGALILRTLELARRAPLPAHAGEEGCWSRAVLVGDEPYYRRFGFRRDLAAGLAFPPPTDPARVLACALVEGAMEGIAGPVAPWEKQRGGRGP